LLFEEVDINDDGSIEWDQFSTYIVNLAEQKNIDKILVNIDVQKIGKATQYNILEKALAQTLPDFD
jgi:proteasome assembly chaperone (PAC2) family protein